MQLRNGNSLVGARRDVFSAAQLTPGRGEKGVPGKKGLARSRSTRCDYERLPGGQRCFPLPVAGGRHGHLLYKVVKALESKAFETLKKWRSDFISPLSPDEVRRVKALTVAAEALWQQHALELARVRKATSDELHVWPDPRPTGRPLPPRRKTPPLSAKCCRSK